MVSPVVGPGSWVPVRTDADGADTSRVCHGGADVDAGAYEGRSANPGLGCPLRPSTGQTLPTGGIRSDQRVSVGLRRTRHRVDVQAPRAQHRAGLYGEQADDHARHDHAEGRAVVEVEPAQDGQHHE